MTIHIKYDNKTFDITIPEDKDTTIKAIKQQIYNEELNHPAEKQVLALGNTTLGDDQTISTAGIKKNATLQLTLKPDDDSNDDHNSNSDGNDHDDQNNDLHDHESDHDNNNNNNINNNINNNNNDTHDNPSNNTPPYLIPAVVLLGIVGLLYLFAPSSPKKSPKPRKKNTRANRPREQRTAQAS